MTKRAGGGAGWQISARENLVFALTAMREQKLRSFLTLLGGVVGVLGGAGIALAVKNLLEFPAAITPPIAFMGLMLSAVVGMVAGYWPARAASNLPVVEALRTE